MSKSRFLDWLYDLGEKSSRTDLWVALIVLFFIYCVAHPEGCRDNPYTDIMLCGMFIDLGLDKLSFLRKTKQE